jgi:hypothetical protein
MSGNRPEGDFVLPFRLINAPHVAGRHVFYNASAFDGGTAGPDARDEAAIASDKQALLPGATAGFANVTNYSKGINGIMVDLARTPQFRTPTTADFEFHVGNGDAADWRPAPAPSGMTFVRGAGVNGTDRATFVWPDGAIKNVWLRVRVKANTNTGLGAADVFYFGNLPAATGDSAPGDRLTVTTIDLLRTRRALFSEATVRSRYDFNRDGRVSPLDLAIVRSMQRASLSLLRPSAAPLPLPDSSSIALEDGADELLSQ